MQKGPTGTIRQRHRFLTTPREFHKRTTLTLFRARHCTGGIQIATAHHCSIRSHVSQLLSWSPVHVAKARTRHLETIPLHVQLQVIRRPVRLFQIIGRVWALLGRRRQRRRQGVNRCHPVAHAGRERLAIEGPAFPHLQIASRPVIEQYRSEHTVPKCVRAHRVTEAVRHSHHETDLGFNVQELARTESDCSVGHTALAGWPSDIGAGRDHARRAPVIAQWLMFPVGAQQVGGQRRGSVAAGPVDLSHIGGVIFRRVKASEVGDHEWHVHLGIVNVYQP